MKKELTRLVLSLGLLFVFSYAANAEWIMTATASSNTSVLTAMGENVLMGTSKDYVYLSTDDGSNWTRISYNAPGLKSGIMSLAASGSTIYAGSIYGLFMSADTGKSWTADTASLLCKKIGSIAANGSNVVVGTKCVTDNGVYFSTNSGEVLTKAISSFPKGNQYVSAAFIDNTFFIGSNILGGTYSSVDKGANWISTYNSGLTDNIINCFAVHGTTIFAGSGGGNVFRSTNSGQSWTKVHFSSAGITAVAVSDNTVFIGTKGRGVYCSTDNGATWNEFNSGLTSHYIYTMAVCRGSLLVAAMDNSYSSSGPIWRYKGAVSVKDSKQGMRMQEIFNVRHNNAKIIVAFSLAKAERVTISVYNLLGYKVNTMVNKNLEAGAYNINLNTMDFATGCYTLRMQVGLNSNAQTIQISR